MQWSKRLSSTTVVTASLLAAAAVMLFAGWTLYRTGREASDASAQVNRSKQVLSAIGAFREGFASIESAQRGFLLTGAPGFLQEREQAIERTDIATADLLGLTSDNALQQARSRQLGLLSAERVGQAHENALRRQREGFIRSWPESVQARAHQTSRQVRALTAAMEEEEARLLAALQAVDMQRQQRTSLVIALSFAAFAATLVPAYAGVLLEARRRRRSEQQMRDIVENLPVTVWQMKTAVDGSRSFIYVGTQAERERGFAPELLLGDHGLSMRSVDPQDQPRLAEAMRRAQESLTPLDCSYRLAAPDAQGGVRWVGSHAQLRRMPDGSILWNGYWADITPQQRLEQALRDATEAANSANRAKSVFLATMSHEIRTPMNGVLGLLELLSLTPLDAEQRATLGVVRESGRSLLRLIDDILDFSKVEAGRLELHPVPASVRDLITRACQVHSGVASSRGLLLEQAIDSGISPALRFDPLRLGQILNNLISNALKFTDQGSVMVAAELAGRTEQAERLRITVTDTGIGVSAEAQSQLFEPFAQAEARTPSQYGGTGLGLAICRRLAALMEGTVTMESEAGRGTRMVFEASFEVADAAQVADIGPEEMQWRLAQTISARRPAPVVDQAEREGTLVLVVDDHPVNRLLLARQVSALGYAVLTAEDGLAALALWQSRRIGLLLTDCNMPGLNGYELAARIRAAESASGGPRLPIVACTANAMRSEAARCAAAGIDDCLIKPVDLMALIERLDQWLPLPAAAAGADATATASAPGGHVAGVFDPSLLELITRGDRALERQILADFRRTNDGDVEQLAAAAAQGDAQEVARLAHRIKGAAQTMGAASLLAACRVLEEWVHRGASGPVDDALQALREETGRLNALLQQRVDPAPA